MLIEPIYYAIFYDTAKPKMVQYAHNKRIDKKIFHNIIDDMGNKEVKLKGYDGDINNYRILSISTFQITNTVDNHLFVVCDCEKII